MTTRKHLENVWKQTGRKPRELAEVPNLPEQFAHLWQYYGELRAGQRLLFGEIESWMRCTRRELSCVEILCLRELDNIFQNVLNERHG